MLESLSTLQAISSHPPSKSPSTKSMVGDNVVACLTTKCAGDSFNRNIRSIPLTPRKRICYIVYSTLGTGIIVCKYYYTEHYSQVIAIDMVGENFIRIFLKFILHKHRKLCENLLENKHGK